MGMMVVLLVVVGGRCGVGAADAGLIVEEIFVLGNITKINSVSSRLIKWHGTHLELGEIHFDEPLSGS